MEDVRRDLTVLTVIALFLIIIVITALVGSPTSFWYTQIVAQLLMAAVALWIAFGRGE